MEYIRALRLAWSEMWDCKPLFLLWPFIIGASFAAAEDAKKLIEKE